MTRTSARRSGTATASRRRRTWSSPDLGRAKLDDEVIELSEWDVLRVSPEVVRSFEGGPEGLALIAVGNDRPEGGDGEMVQEFWTD